MMNARNAVIIYLRQKIDGPTLDRQVERVMLHPEVRQGVVYWMQIVMQSLDIERLGAVTDEHFGRVDEIAEESLDERVSQKSR